MNSQDLNSASVQEMASPDELAHVSVTWSNPSEETAGMSSEAPASNETSERDSRRNLGLWLLFSAFLRRDPWARLSMSSLANSSTTLPTPTFWYGAIKRSSDIAVSLVLLLLLFPIFAAVGLLIKLDTPGPVFFRQRRVGKDGKMFQLWKFRSMKIGAMKYEISPKSDSDWRVTRFGHLIRRVSIDELPQLLNVLRGEMSLVGPRPEMPFIVNRYTKQERRRLAVKPGITGLWQVSPARAFPIHHNLQYDLHYIQHQNLALEAAILLYTAVAVIRGTGAV